MSTLRELFEATKAKGSMEEYGATRERQRARISDALEKLLAKEFSGNDRLQSDLHNGMMTFYDGHMHISKKSQQEVMQDAADALKQLINKRTVKITIDGKSLDIVGGALTMSLEMQYQSTLGHAHSTWDLIVQGNKSDIEVGQFDGLEDAAGAINEIFKMGVKWLQEYDPHFDRY